MGFPGTWMTPQGDLAYRVVPKCACSTIGQVLYFRSFGRFYDGDIHDEAGGLLKWQDEAAQTVITDAVTGQTARIFTCVRNPYTRVLSAYFDKVCGTQRNGKRYRAGKLPELLERYGITPDEQDDQIGQFRRFLLFARDTIRFRKPTAPDIHWSAASGHLSTLVRGGGRFDWVVSTERLTDELAQVLAETPGGSDCDLTRLPRFNESAGHGLRREHPVSAYFDDLAHHLMDEIYGRDFRLFGYDFDDPDRSAPVRSIDLDRVHRALAA